MLLANDDSGLGRKEWGMSVWPQLRFDDLWFALPARHRAAFLHTVLSSRYRAQYEVNYFEVIVEGVAPNEERDYSKTPTVNVEHVKFEEDIDMRFDRVATMLDQDFGRMQRYEGQEIIRLLSEASTIRFCTYTVMYIIYLKSKGHWPDDTPDQGATDLPGERTEGDSHPTQCMSSARSDPDTDHVPSREHSPTGRPLTSTNHELSRRTEPSTGCGSLAGQDPSIECGPSTATTSLKEESQSAASALTTEPIENPGLSFNVLWTLNSQALHKTQETDSTGRQHALVQDWIDGIRDRQQPLEGGITQHNIDKTKYEDTVDDISTVERSRPDSPGFIQRVHNLPPELFHAIQETFFQTVFGPRKMHIDLGPFDYEHVKHALDDTLLKKYDDVLYSENEWTYGDWHTGDGAIWKFPQRIPQYKNVDFFRIKRMYVSMKTRDYCSRKDKDPMKFEPGEHWKVFPNALEALRAFQDHCQSAEYELILIWIDKWQHITRYGGREHICLDMSETFGLDGEYLGLKATQAFERVPRLEWHLPFPNLKSWSILGPGQNIIDRMTEDWV